MLKKVLVLGVTALTTASLFGCQATTEKEEGNKETSQVETDGNKENSVTTEQEVNQKNETEEVVLAKVTKSVGNELSVNISKEKYDLAEGETVMQGTVNIELTDSQKETLEKDGIVYLEDGSFMMSTNYDQEVPEGYSEDEDPGISDEEFQELVDQGLAFEGEDETLEDIFGGFSFDEGAKDFIISAGAVIFDARTGKDGTLSDIKEGTVLNIKLDTNTDTVIRIDILE